jgi:hypothetical protein
VLSAAGERQARSNRPERGPERLFPRSETRTVRVAPFLPALRTAGYLGNDRRFLGSDLLHPQVTDAASLDPDRRFPRSEWWFPCGKCWPDPGEVVGGTLGSGTREARVRGPGSAGSGARKPGKRRWRGLGGGGSECGRWVLESGKWWAGARRPDWRRRSRSLETSSKRERTPLHKFATLRPSLASHARRLSLSSAHSKRGSLATRRPGSLQIHNVETHQA